MIIVDSREKKNEHIINYFDRHHIEYTVRKLDVGDYMDDANPEQAVERKASLAELAHNMLTGDRKRFYNEIRRARSDGIKLIILCEEASVKAFADVRKWVPKYGKATGKALSDAIFRLEVGYGVPTFFCGKRSSGKRILEILSEANNGNENHMRGE